MLSDKEKQEYLDKVNLLKDEANKLIEEFNIKMKELHAKSITPYSRLFIQVFAPVEVEWRKNNETFIDDKTNKEMYRYWLSEVEIRPLTLVSENPIQEVKHDILGMSDDELLTYLQSQRQSK